MAGMREQRRIVSYLDGLPAKLNALPALRSSGRLQSPKAILSASGEELRRRRTLMPSMPALSVVEGLDKAFKGEL
jgi:hypothetical protein